MARKSRSIEIKTHSETIIIQPRLSVETRGGPVSSALEGLGKLAHPRASGPAHFLAGAQGRASSPVRGARGQPAPSGCPEGEGQALPIGSSQGRAALAGPGDPPAPLLACRMEAQVQGAQAVGGDPESDHLPRVRTAAVRARCCGLVWKQRNRNPAPRRWERPAAAAILETAGVPQNHEKENHLLTQQPRDRKSVV